MEKRLSIISSIIDNLPDVKIIRAFRTINEKILGRVEVNQNDICLEFEVEIFSFYPLQIHENESIRFLNSKLISYNHVNRDGSICIHTTHSPDVKRKLEWDFNSLKQWIEKYYSNNNKDNHYEHIVVSEYQDEVLSCYLFTEVKHSFQKHTFGNFLYSPQAFGYEGKNEKHTFLIHNFFVDKIPYECGWSTLYKQQRDFKQGIYVYIEIPPVKHKRFAVETWSELEPFVSQQFLKFLYDIDKMGSYKKAGIKKLPLLIGYKIPTEEIH